MLACACGDEHIGLVAHDELDWAPLGLSEDRFLNLFASPLGLSEFVAALLIVAAVKVMLTFAVLAALGYAFYAFNVFALGLHLLPFLLVLFVFGWAMGLVVAALIVRFGSRISYEGGADVAGWA